MKAVPAPAPCDDSLPPARVYLPEVPQPSRAALPAEGPSVEACRGPAGRAFPIEAETGKKPGVLESPLPRRRQETTGDGQEDH